MGGSTHTTKSVLRGGGTSDFPIDRKMLPEIRKHFERSTQLLGRWLSIADDFVDSAVHKVEIEREYNGRNADAHSQAISKTLEIWLSLGTDVATFNKLVGIIVDYDPACAARLREDEDRIKMLRSD